MATGMREEITQWFTGNDTSFLIGAGCSACAGKPLIGKLTENVLNNHDEGLNTHFNSLKTIGNRQPTIEDLINFLVRYREILRTITTPEEHDLSIDQIDEWLAKIKKSIVTEVADDWQPSPYHERFLERLRGSNELRPRDIFSLNYDTLIESSLDSLRLPYVDGFRGTNRAWFDLQTFDEAGMGIAYRIHKLHGSINWTRDNNGHVRRGRNANEDASDEPVVVYPSEQKYLQTQFGVYESLIGRFRDRLRSNSVNNHLVVLGYSFNDEHVNEAIFDAINAPNSNLTVIAFVGPEEDIDAQKQRLQEFSKRCDYRFNVFVGGAENGFFLGHATDAESAHKVLELELWQFENLVDYIAGVES